MTTKVAFQSTKRRKMGYDVDYFNDSGVPMDGIELDSSSSNALAAGSTSAASILPTSDIDNVNTTSSSSSSIIGAGVGGSSCAGASSASTRVINGIASIDSNTITNSFDSRLYQNDNSSLVGTTNNNIDNTIVSTNNSIITNNITNIDTNINTATKAAISSVLDQNRQLTPPLQASMNEEPTPMYSTNNEAMTNDDPSTLNYNFNDSGLERSIGQNSPDYRMTDDSNPVNDERPNQGSNGNTYSLNQGSSSSLSSMNEVRKNSKEKSSTSTAVRSFGDLFDDDDLD